MEKYSSRRSLPAQPTPEGFQAVASACGDYAKKSFEGAKAFVEKLSGMKLLDRRTEFAKSGYDALVADSQKIAGLYRDLAKPFVMSLETIVSKSTAAASHRSLRVPGDFEKPGRLAGLFLGPALPAIDPSASRE
jgi:hypothetical protein